MLQKPRLLVVPLDWGLGHATRCIPIVTELLANDCEVWLAGEGMQEALLRSEFPALPFLPLPGYRVAYSKTKKGLFWKMLVQIPSILSAIRKENIWLEEMISTHHFNAVISDNRFGLYHNSTPTVFITHQLNVKTPLGKWNERILQRWNYQYINRFSECWVPDMEGEINLAGGLSHPHITPGIPVKYIGPLSRFEKLFSHEIPGHLLIILSGPEPQRSIFENKVIDEVSHYPGTITVIRGLPSSLSVIPSSGMIKFYNHLPAKELNEEIEKAEWVLARCGYSTVMDLLKLKKKSILVPTPGQTEQEYLAGHLMKKQEAFCTTQDNFSLSSVLKEAGKFNFQFPEFDFSQKMKTVVRDFVSGLKRS